MASFPKVATDFDQIIQADRQRKKNEELAKEIFGRSRQKDKRKDDKRPGRTSTPSLASRVGVAKRSSSTSSNNPSPRLQPKPRSSFPAQNARNTRLANDIDNEVNTNVVPTQPKALASNISSGSGISIKGASGPFVLHASNFAPGTTAADIEAAIHQDTIFTNGISSLASCKVIRTRPDVVAELVFTEKIVADNIISKYNGQKADGRILAVDLVRSGVGSMSKSSQLQQTQSQPQPQQQQQQGRRDRQSQPPSQSVQAEPEIDVEPEIDMINDNAMEDVDMEPEAPATIFKDEREAADRDRRDRDSRRDRTDIHDSGSKRHGNNDDRRRDDRDRDRELDRSRDRDYNSRRDERPRDDPRTINPISNPNPNPNANTRASHYGNGVGVGPRGGFGGGYGGGSSGPGGYRGNRFGEGYGGRGGYRGGYRGYR